MSSATSTILSYHGYGCVKGRSFLEFHSAPGRVPHPLQRDADGELRRTTSASALDGIAHRLWSILAKHGPRSACWRMGRGICRPGSTRPCDRISRYRAVLARTREDR
jgi:anaerobic selenocysteine-containing dehydrogenase